MWMVGPPGRATVAVAPDGHVLGTANMYANRPGMGAHVASGNVLVAAEHQGRGVGRALLADLLEWALEEGFRGVQFDAVAARTCAPSACTSRWASRPSGPCPRGSSTRWRASSGST